MIKFLTISLIIVLGCVFSISCLGSEKSYEGKYIIFSGRDRNTGGYHLYLTEINIGHPIKISWNEYNDYSPIISPNDDRVFFISDRRGNKELFTFQLEWVGGTTQWLGDWIWENYPEAPRATPLKTEVEWTAFSSISPSGQYITCMQYPGGQYDIILMSTDGSFTKNLSNGYFDDYYPQFSSDGMTVIYQTKRSATDIEIFLTDLDGSKEWNLSNHWGGDYISKGPCFSPENDRIVFTSDRNGNMEIYIMDIDGSHQDRLTMSAGMDYNPVFSPDGDKIAFVSDRDGNQEIYTMKIDGTDQKNISRSIGNDHSPKFSPDGNYIAYISDRDSILQIYTYDFVTMNSENLVNSKFLSGATFDFFYAR